MNASESLTNLIKKLYQNGKTDKEIGEIAGCSHAHINYIRNGQRNIENSSLDLILRLFPELDGVIAAACQAKLEGRPVSMTQQANGNTNSQISQTMGAADAADAVARYRQQLSDAILALAIPADAKVQVLSLLKQIGDKI